MTIAQDLKAGDRRRDELATVPRYCPMGCVAGSLIVDKPRYGWGNMGAQLKCSRCGLRVRLPWVPLASAVERRQDRLAKRLAEGRSPR